MTKKTSNRFSPEVRQRAVRMVLEHGGDHASQWAVIGSIAGKTGCTAGTLRAALDAIAAVAREWLRAVAPADSGGRPPARGGGQARRLRGERRDAAHLGPRLEGARPGGAELDGGDVVAAEREVNRAGFAGGSEP